MIVTEYSTDFFARREAGGKGYNLYLMTRAGLNVPSWIILGQEFFRLFLKEQNLEKKIDACIVQFERAEKSAFEVEKEIEDLFLNTIESGVLNRALEQAYKVLDKDSRISVRSSAGDEDSHSHSFAGQLSSFLYVEGRVETIKHIKKVWASAFSERSLVYRKENHLDFQKISVAVILQEMIDADKSGVLFTCEPIEQNISQFVISASYGVGEGMVSGAVDADTFWIESTTGHLLKSEIIDKREKMVRARSGLCHLIPNEEIQRQISCLGAHDLIALYSAGRKIQKFYRRPQDIEFAFKNEKLYLLQSRPVTSLSQNLVEYPNLWDNSNIVESYGGLTLPLSFSFALRNYKAVYVQFCEVLGVPQNIIKDMDSYLGNMLGILKGRVYYNLYNWYKLVGVLPGFKQNRQFMETMMGVNEALGDEIDKRIEPHPSWSTWSGRLRKMVTGFYFLIYHFRIQNLVDSFLKNFHRDFRFYRKLPLGQMRGDELIQIYFEVERKMLGQWKAPIINDFLCMVHFGLLRKLTQNWLKQLDDTLQNDLLAGEGGYESAEPTRRAIVLAKMALKLPSLTRLILETPVEDGLEAINQSEFKEFYIVVKKYIDDFGFRCMSEMKLEEIDLTTNPSYLFTILKNYLRGDHSALDSEDREHVLRKKAEKNLNEHLKSWRLIVYKWVLKHARKAVKNRENTRFARTRIYGIARSIFRRIGEDLARQNILTQPRDIFWITIEEVSGIYNGTLPSCNLVALIQLRKQEYSQFDKEIDARIFTRGPVYWNNQFIKEQKIEILPEGIDLKGLPCCPGIVEGVVKVIVNPTDDLCLNGEILVTPRTDPGWVPLYPSISGLLVERGSLLSHSAIVAREMGIPAIVSVPQLLQKLSTGMRIRIDGKAGTIKILDANLVRPESNAKAQVEAAINPEGFSLNTL
jgi:pyruvate,water dikinase